MYWDIFISAVTLYSCTVTTLQMALMDDDNLAWTIANYIVDLFFLIDIFAIFNSAIFDKDGEVITDRWKIAKDYFKSWFFIDLIAIVPF